MKFSICASIISLTLFKYANAACSGPYAQCGGNNYAGESCCVPGYKCVTLNEWYSQCQEDNSNAAAPEFVINPIPEVVSNTISETAPYSIPEFIPETVPPKSIPEYSPEAAPKSIPEGNPEYTPTIEATDIPIIPQTTEIYSVPTIADEPINNNIQSSISASTENFFLKGEIYRNPRFIEEVESSITKLSPELAAKAEKVKDIPTAVWLAWDGAPGEVEGHLINAGSSQTVVFLLYMIPTRDCNSNASAGGASGLDVYKGYVDDISNTIKSHPETNVVMVVEPDTLGNLVTATSEACQNVHTLHKNALAYAINVFGAMNNVSVYLDAAHGMWLSDYADETAAVIKEILDNAPNGKIRGFSTNVSNYQPIYTEYEYYVKLNASLENLGVTGMHYILDTGRNGVDVYESFGKSKTWCNYIGTGLGERPKANPDSSMPLIDAYMWLKTPGEADGSSVGDRADPVCAREDSLPGAPDAGSWFHDYFVQLLENANPTF